MYERLSQQTAVDLILRHCTYLRHGEQNQKWKFGCDPGRIITNTHFWACVSVSRHLTVLQRVQIPDGRTVLFLWVWTRIWWSFSISRGLPLAHPCWGYYIVGDDLQLSCLVASLPMLPVTNPRTSSCHIWWLYPLCLHRHPQPVHDLCHVMLHSFNFLPMAMNSTP